MNDKELCEMFGTTLEQVEKDVGIYESGDLSSFEFEQIDNESIFPFVIETDVSDFTDSLPGRDDWLYDEQREQNVTKRKEQVRGIENDG